MTASDDEARNRTQAPDLGFLELTIFELPQKGVSARCFLEKITPLRNVLAKKHRFAGKAMRRFSKAKRNVGGGKRSVGCAKRRVGVATCRVSRVKHRFGGVMRRAGRGKRRIGGASMLY